MKYLYYILSIAIILLSISCGEDEVVTPGKKIIIAAILDTSGHYSQFGKEVKQGIELFRSKYYTSFDVKYYDSKADADIALRALDEAAADSRVRAVVTLASWITNALAEPAKNHKLLQIAVGSAVFQHADLKNCVRMTSDVSSEIKYLSDYLQNYERIAVMYFNNDYGRGWESSLRNALGDKIVGTFSYPDTLTNFNSIIQEVKMLAPERVVLISTREAAYIVHQARQLGLNAQLVGTRPILTDFLLSMPDSDGLIFSYPNINTEIPAYKDYISRYSKKPSSFVAEGFDLCLALENAIKTKGSAPSKMWGWFPNNAYTGLLGTVRFDSLGQATYDYSLKIIHKGDIQTYEQD